MSTLFLVTMFSGVGFLLESMMLKLVVGNFFFFSIMPHQETFGGKDELGNIWVRICMIISH